MRLVLDKDVQVQSEQGVGGMNYLAIAQAGFDAWAEKPHNKKWFKRIDGTPIPNDLVVCIAQAFHDAALPEVPAAADHLDQRGGQPLPNRKPDTAIEQRN